MSYLVQPGDSLAGIAESVYGDAALWETIRDANPDTVHLGTLLVIGEVLDLPEVCIEAGGQCTEPAPEATLLAVTPAELFKQLVAMGRVEEALDLLPWLEPLDCVELGSDVSVLESIATGFPLVEAVFTLGALGAPVLKTLAGFGSPALSAALNTCDPLVASLLAEEPDGPSLIREMLLDNAAFADFLFGYSVAPQEQVLFAGFDMSSGTCGPTPLDPDLLIRILTRFTQAERQEVLLLLRDAGEWEILLGGLGAEHVPLVQEWLAEDEGDATGQTLQERVDAATNSDRGRDAQARIAAVAATDVNQPPRLTDRLVELLVLGVALPRLDANDLATEGVLGAVQAERAAAALVAMPDQEYLRTVMLLDLTGDEARLTESFLLLKALAARRDRFSDADAGNDSAGELESFSDRIRGMDAEEAITATSVTQQTATGVGLQQNFTMSCGASSGVVIGAEADPIRGLALNDAGVDVTDTGGDHTATTEAALENHGGNVAQLRPEAVTSLTNDIGTATTALTGTTPAAQLLAVNNYITNAAFDQAAFDLGIVAIRTQLARDGYPNDQQLRLLRETAGGGAAPGLNATAIATEYNNDATIDADGVTGAPFAANAPANLGGYRATLPAGVFPAVIPEAIATQVDALLTTAATHLEDGYDVGFGVQWSGSGGHAMVLTNVRGSGAAQAFLIHDPWAGTTAWVLGTDLRQAQLTGLNANRGLLYRLAEPTPPASP